MATQPGDARNASQEGRRFLQQHAEGLSDTTTRYARWIHSPSEGEDHEGRSLATCPHEAIRAWAEKRGAKPAAVPNGEHDGHVGVLRLDFPGYGGSDLQEIWEGGSSRSTSASRCSSIRSTRATGAAATSSGWTARSRRATELGAREGDAWASRFRN